MQNNARKDKPSVFNLLMDKPPKPTSVSVANEAILTELACYTNSFFIPTDEDLIKKHGPLLFFKEHEKNYPILCEIVKGIFCLLPASTSIEGVFTSSGLIHNERRKRLNPKLLEDLTMLSYNKKHI